MVAKLWPFKDWISFDPCWVHMDMPLTSIDNRRSEAYSIFFFDNPAAHVYEDSGGCALFVITCNL